MDITVSTTLSDEEVDELVNALGCTSQELPARIEQLGRASVREYVEMLLGSNPLRSTENRKRRLLLIMLEAQNGQIVDEVDVARYFNITLLSARSLLRSVMSKHRRQMKPVMDEAARKIIQDCGDEGDDSKRKVIIRNVVVVEYMNALLATQDGTLQRITLNPGTGNQYIMQSDAYDKLDEILP